MDYWFLNYCMDKLERLTIEIEKEKNNSQFVSEKNWPDLKAEWRLKCLREWKEFVRILLLNWVYEKST